MSQNLMTEHRTPDTRPVRRSLDELKSTDSVFLQKRTPDQALLQNSPPICPSDSLQRTASDLYNTANQVNLNFRSIIELESSLRQIAEGLVSQQDQLKDLISVNRFKNRSNIITN